MARVDTVIDYGLYGVTAEDALDGVFDSIDVDTVMSAQVAAMAKKAGAISILGSNDKNWTQASICAASIMGFPATPDTFEISVEVDGSHIFGHNTKDRWTFMPDKDDLPGLMVPSEGLDLEDRDTYVEKTASSWVKEGVAPEMVLALAGLGIKLRLDDETNGLPSLERIKQRRKDSDPTVTSGVMLKFASKQYDDMWLGEVDSVTALTELALVLEKYDPANSVHIAVEELSA